MQGSQNPQNYKFAPQITEIITSAAQLLQQTTFSDAFFAALRVNNWNHSH